MSAQATQTRVDNVRAILAKDKLATDTEITQFLLNSFPEYSKGYTEFSKVATDSFAKILGNGGKRLRASLLLNTYRSMGGTDEETSLKAALAVEVIHAYLLVIDDFCDLSLLRRGSDSAHTIIENYASANDLSGDQKHFGYSVAVTAGIAGMHIASDIICDLKIADVTKVQVLKELNSCVLMTAHGQFNDMYNEVIDPASVTKESILNVMKWKTAQYTFYNPIKVGVLLAGANVDNLTSLEEYSINAGLAFQVKDDILGMFGNEVEIGKPVIDDLREGKVTLLMANALELSSEDDRQQLLNLLGNKEVTNEDLETAKAIIKRCGALSATTTAANEYCNLAIKALGNADISLELNDYLLGVAELIVARNN